jgi:hypothetical protein
VKELSGGGGVYGVEVARAREVEVSASHPDVAMHLFASCPCAFGLSLCELEAVHVCLPSAGDS